MPLSTRPSPASPPPPTPDPGNRLVPVLRTSSTKPGTQVPGFVHPVAWTASRRVALQWGHPCGVGPGSGSPSGARRSTGEEALVARIGKDRKVHVIEPAPAVPDTPGPLTVPAPS